MVTRQQLQPLVLCRRILKALQHYPEGLPLGETWEEKGPSLWKETFGKKQELLICLEFLEELHVVIPVEGIYRLSSTVAYDMTRVQLMQEMRTRLWIHMEKFFEEERKNSGAFGDLNDV